MSVEPALNPASWRSERNRTVLLPILTFVLLTIGLALMIFRFFVLDFVVAASIALLLGPLQRTLTKLMGGRGAVAAALLVLLVTIIIFVPILTSAMILSSQAGAFFAWLGPRLRPGELQKLLTEALPAHPLVTAWLDFAKTAGIPPLVADSLDRLAVGANAMLQGAVARFGAALFDLMLFLLMLFFLLKDGGGLRSEFRRISPFSEEQETQIFDHISRTVKGVLQAMVVVPVVQGMLAGLGFWWFGVPSPLVWGVCVVFAAFVPLIGSPLGWVPAAVYLLYTGPTAPAVGLALYGLIVISGIDNVIKPLILHGAAQIHPLLGFLSILGGVLAFGPLGFLVGPIVLSLVISGIRIYRDDVLARRLVSGPVKAAAQS